MNLLGIGLGINGVKNRCRKCKFQWVRIGRIEPDKLNEQELIEKAKKYALENFKEIKTAYVSIQPMTVIATDDGHEIEQWALLTDRKIPLTFEVKNG